MLSMVLNTLLYKYNHNEERFYRHWRQIMHTFTTVFERETQVKKVNTCSEILFHKTNKTYYFSSVLNDIYLTN